MVIYPVITVDNYSFQNEYNLRPLSGVFIMVFGSDRREHKLSGTNHRFMVGFS